MEFALVAPLLFALVLGAIDFGWMFSQNHDLRSAAREGARMAVVNGGTGSTPDARRDDLIARTKTRAQQLTASSIQVYVQLENTNGDAITGDAGDDVVVCLSYPKQSLSHFYSTLLSGTMTTKAIMRMEQQATFSSGGTAGFTGTCTS